MAETLSQVTLQPNFNAERYSGKWYTIAEIPQSYTERCTYSTAEYTLPGRKAPKNLALNVLNTCYDRRYREIDSGEGQAFSFYPDYPAALTVRFPFVDSKSHKPNYLVHRTNYREYSIVGSLNYETLWILSRTKKLNRYRFAQLLRECNNLGYDIQLLRLTPHSIDESGRKADKSSYNAFINMAMERSEEIREYHDDPIGVAKKPKIDRYLYDEASSLMPPKTLKVRHAEPSAVSLPEPEHAPDHHQHLDKMNALKHFPNILVPAGRR